MEVLDGSSRLAVAAVAAMAWRVGVIIGRLPLHLDRYGGTFGENNATNERTTATCRMSAPRHADGVTSAEQGGGIGLTAISQPLKLRPRKLSPPSARI